jgi:hypothetical protein
MVNVLLDALPEALVASINKAKFKIAYHLPERGRYIARHVLPSGRREELEYDVALGRCLTIEERKAEIPLGQRKIADHNVTVASTYFIDDDTSQLLDLLEAFDDTGHRLLNNVGLVHAPYTRNEEELVKEALRQRNFPAVYATWPKEQKIGYWGNVLHRYRRTNGESGRDEDDIYTLGLITDMEKIDPSVRELLPDILAQVGWLEQTPADKAIAAFSSRTGIQVGRPTIVLHSF